MLIYRVQKFAMQTSDLIALASLLVSLVAAAYARAAAHSSRSNNELTFRSEWLAAYDAMRQAQFSLCLPTGPFAKLTESVKRGFPRPLESALVCQLRAISGRAELWADERVHIHLKDALMWNEQLDCLLEYQNSDEKPKSSERRTEFTREAANYAEDSRKSFGLALDIVRARLRDSAP